MKKLSRNTNQRKALIRNLMRSLILHGAIKTSKAKAQAIRSEVEKLITKAKKGTEASQRQIFASLPYKDIVKMLVEKSETQFSSRNSGYTRITKIGKRLGDASEEVILSFVDEVVVQEVITPKTKQKATVVTEKDSDTETLPVTTGKVSAKKAEKTKEEKPKRVVKSKKEETKK